MIPDCKMSSIITIFAFQSWNWIMSYSVIIEMSFCFKFLSAFITLVCSISMSLHMILECVLCSMLLATYITYKRFFNCQTSQLMLIQFFSSSESISTFGTFKHFSSTVKSRMSSQVFVRCCCKVTMLTLEFPFLMDCFVLESIMISNKFFFAKGTL